MIDYFPDEFYESLGEPKPGHPCGLLEAYRFQLVLEQLVPGNVLDVGAYYGDFLKLAHDAGHEIKGVEINMARVKLANSILGNDVVVLDSRNGSLASFGDNDFDNVVCMEVIEHQPDDRLALAELCRVARSRVIITVPFQENIQKVICLHCHQYTPYSGHLHRYDYGAFQQLAPDDWRVTVEMPFANTISRRLGGRLSTSKTTISLLWMIDKIFSTKKSWIMVVLEPAT